MTLSSHHGVYHFCIEKGRKKERRSALVVEAHVPVRYQVSASLISTSPEWSSFMISSRVR